MIPLSFAQQRLWFIAQLEGPSAVYNSPVALRLDGDLNTAALEAALADVMERHQVLRTVFPATGGQPRQRVLAMSELSRELPVTKVAADDLQTIARRAASQSFNCVRVEGHTSTNDTLVLLANGGGQRPGAGLRAVRGSRPRR